MQGKIFWSMAALYRRAGKVYPFRRQAIDAGEVFNLTVQEHQTRWLPGWQIAALSTYFAPVRATRPFSPQTTRTASRARHASAPANHPDAVSSTRPYLNAHHTPCPARAHTRKLPQCRAQHAPVPQRAPHAVPSTRPHPHTTLFSAAPPVSTPGGPSRDPGPQV